MKSKFRKVIFTALFISIYGIANSQMTTEEVNNKRSPITCIAYKDPLTFAGTWGTGVYMSADSGKLWTKLSNGLPDDGRIRKLEVSGSNIIAITFENGMFLSTNNGSNWVKVKVSPESKKYKGLVAFKGKVFAGSEQGIIESNDNGVSFSPVAKRYPGSVSDMVTNGDVALAEIYSDEKNEHVFYSTTDGLKWQEVKSVDKWNEYKISTDEGFIYVNNCRVGYSEPGFYTCRGNELWVLSLDGKKWSEIDFRAREFAFNNGNIYAIKVTIDDKKDIVTYKREILISKDRGKSWLPISESEPFVASDDRIQAKLQELEEWKDIEIKEAKLAIQGLAINTRELAEKKAAIKRSQMYGPQIIYSAPTPNSSPNYRQLSNQRFNRMHNPKYNPDTKY